MILDYHPESQRLLTQAALREQQSFRSTITLTLWKVTPASAAIAPVLRWDVTPPDDIGTRAPDSPWGRIVDANIVVQRYTSHTYVGWDIEQKRGIYRVGQETFWQPDPVISGGRKYLFIPNDDSMRVVDTRTGSLLSVNPASSRVTGIALNAEGTTAATLSGSRVTVWDLTSATAEPQVYQSASIGSSFGSRISWVGDNRLMSIQAKSTMSLYSLKYEHTVWTYRTDESALWDGERARTVIDNHLVYGASVGPLRNGLAVGAVRLPGPRVDEATADLDLNSLLILRRGSEIRLEVNTGQYDARVRAALVKEIKANGWRLSPNAVATLKAEMGRGKTQTVTYNVRGRNESATMTPHFASLQILVGKAVAWSSRSGDGLPPTIWLREGESVQSKVKEWSNPNPGFFDHVNIPDEIFDPAKRGGLGTTMVTNRGLVPKP